MLYTSDYDFDSDSFTSEKQHYDQNNTLLTYLFNLAFISTLNYVDYQEC